MAVRTEKSTIPAKGDRGLSEFGIGGSYSEARSNDKAGISRGRGRSWAAGISDKRGVQDGKGEPLGRVTTAIRPAFP